MMPPRRADTPADPTLVTGLVGAAALLDALRALLGELADNGDRCVTGAEPARDGVFEEVVDAVLGLAALAHAARRHLPRDAAPVGREAAAPPTAERSAPVTWELLR